MDDVETLKTWLAVCLVIASVCTTLFPILYSFSPWYKSWLGRALMLQAVAFSITLDLTLVFYLVQGEPDIVRLYAYCISFSFIAGATAFLTYKMIKNNYKNYFRKNPEMGIIEEERYTHG